MSVGIYVVKNAFSYVLVLGLSTTWEGTLKATPVDGSFAADNSIINFC